MPWIYGAVAIGGTVAALAAIVIVVLLLRPSGLAGGPPYQWFPFFWFFLFVGFLVVIFLLKWCFWGWGWRSSCWHPYGGGAIDERPSESKRGLSDVQGSVNLVGSPGFEPGIFSAQG